MFHYAIFDFIPDEYVVSLENCVTLHKILEIMRYRIKKETKPTLPTYGKYKAVAVHNQTIESRQLFEEAARGTTLSAGMLEGLISFEKDRTFND